MHPKTDGTKHSERTANNNNLFEVSSQPWWCSIGQDAISRDGLAGSRKNLSPIKQANGLETKSSEPKDKHGADERILSNKAMQLAVSSQPDGKYEEQQPHPQHATSNLTPAIGEYIAPPTQLELVGHSIACPTYPYLDPYLGGVIPAFSPQALVHPHLGVHPARMALPLEMAEEPVYVNAKQYHGILRRRQSRAKHELEKKLIKVRKPYLHESRHLHAMRRARGSGGRFLNTKKLESNSSDAAATDKGNDSGYEGVREVHVNRMHSQHTFSNGNGSFLSHHQGFQLSASHSLSDNMVEGGDCSVQQRERIAVTGVPHRALTIK